MHGRSEVILVFVVVVHLELIIPVLDSHIEVLAISISLLDHLHLEPDQPVIRVYVEL